MIKFLECINKLEEQATKDIEISHPGVEGLSEDGWKEMSVKDLVKHFLTKAKSKGKAEITKSIMNIERWNKNKNKDLSDKARSVMNKLMANKEWNSL